MPSTPWWGGMSGTGLLARPTITARWSGCLKQTSSGCRRQSSTLRESHELAQFCTRLLVRTGCCNRFEVHTGTLRSISCPACLPSLGLVSL